MINDSAITFIELTKGIHYYSVIWNGELVYDNTSIFDLWAFQSEYQHKIVYHMCVDIIEGSKIVLQVEGE